MLTYKVEAEYVDGYIHREDEQDTSHYAAGKNIFSDIVQRLPEAEHGKTKYVTLNTPDERIVIDFTVLPDNAIPVRDIHFQRRASMSGQWLEDARVTGVDFGYQYVDADGQCMQEIINL